MSSDDFRERHDRMRREHEAFDRKFRWMFIISMIIALALAAAMIALITGGAVWLWGVVT